jgi:Fe-S-cluster containining protein
MAEKGLLPWATFPYNRSFAVGQAKGLEALQPPHLPVFKGINGNHFSHSSTYLLTYKFPMSHQDQFADGRRKLQRPILPLVRLVQLLYLTGPFENMAAVLTELPDPLETGSSVYDRPAAIMAPYLSLLETCDLKNKPVISVTIYDETGAPLSAFDAAELWLKQQVLIQELEEINSLLCNPCGCTLCCTGPEESMAQEFFEIPLTSAESSLFKLPKMDSAASRQHTALTEPSLIVEGRPFYEKGPGLYHWQNGWSLILPRGNSCPQLEPTTGRCLIYPHRPGICRRPQIFSYLIERVPDLDGDQAGHSLPAYVSRRKLLAVWDCPYVRGLKEEIAAYAEACDMEPVFRSNKA